jgi:hypothetical protein
MYAVLPFDLRCQFKLLGWRELIAILPEDLQEFRVLPITLIGSL